MTVKNRWHDGVQPGRNGAEKRPDVATARQSGGTSSHEPGGARTVRPRAQGRFHWLFARHRLNEAPWQWRGVVPGDEQERSATRAGSASATGKGISFAKVDIETAASTACSVRRRSSAWSIELAGPDD